MTAKQLAKDVVLYANQCGYPITNLKLQKILYYLQGYYGKTFEDSLFSDEIKHWPYGPVVPSVYFEYCAFGASAIFEQSSNAPFSDCNKQEQKVIRKVLDKCLPMTASDLVDKSHEEAPWRDTKSTEIIPFNAILHYFKENDPLRIGSL